MQKHQAKMSSGISLIDVLMNVCEAHLTGDNFTAKTMKKSENITFMKNTLFHELFKVQK